MTLERTVTIRPAYDCIGVQPCVHGSANCKPGSGGSHGRHSAEMHFSVRGADAEIILVISTCWDLPTVPECHRSHGPKGAFVEFHTGRPRYENQDRNEPSADAACEHWAGCYTDTGYTMADKPTALLVEKGLDAVWEWLETMHAETIADMNREAAE